ncbi:hypothetical protein ABB37_06408 [Leptomonas pyrrhocoris]|uniref:Uncharacterized protein n=1 Tax=Leptomonas pyrrhocoris TaxID=157538 RepID=A0A0M9FY41_LEPPY|nr:hypothetical protein ABB37_06408 [Leptomonas pyrrhocoris]KPA78256.1 hypothetical protein ABB37_06408 [Leptomonas pyrrhocoris]|eukprot:XP_015656695.1 hypothetical protein ABB37_06408 [Leptomonas pyrrhocoris]
MPSSSSSSPASPLRSVFDALEKKYPQYHAQFDLAQKAASQAAVVLDKAAPYLAQVPVYAAAAKEQAKKYRLEEFVPMLIGLALCFFGGAYTMLIAVVETVRLVCWEDLQNSFAVLKRNYEIAAEQNRKDNAIDADGNGVADVQEMDRNELFTRKAALFLKSVDIESVQTAARTIASAFLSVMATLRVKFARSLALGGSLTNMAKEYIHLEQWLSEVLPPDTKKWAGVLANVVVGAVTMTFATLLSGVISIVHCCICGANMCVQHAIRIASERGLLEEDISMESTRARALVAMVAAMGFFWQLSHSGSQPFPFNLILLPLTIAEFLLNLCVGGFLYALP